MLLSEAVSCSVGVSRINTKPNVWLLMHVRGVGLVTNLNAYHLISNAAF